ncbi:MAG: (2Fe-2S)-binding protein [Myxococcales bacterium]|jgi:carbon-monoxide dehydrogenase small subunit|nr:(2Fe-2S)-binding protein [Myxococcales bacterium]
MRHTISVRVNGIDELQEVEPHLSLLTFLRDTLGLTGAKEGCNEGECGSCMILFDGTPVNACLTLAVEADGHEITTIEGVGDAKHLHPLQSAFLKHHAVQCGFCTPGMIMTTIGLLRENPDPSEHEIKVALAGNLCRCTGYRQIIEAIQEGAAVLRTEKGSEQP